MPQRGTKIMGNRVTEGFKLLVCSFQLNDIVIEFFVEFYKLILRLLALGKIPGQQLSDKISSFIGIGQGYIHWELTSVLPFAV